jgi:TPR repeat protein
MGDPIKGNDSYDLSVNRVDEKCIGRFNEAMKKMEGFNLQEKRDKGLKLMEGAAICGHRGALVLRGSYYQEGVLVERDLEKSREYFMSALEKGSGEAAWRLGGIYFNNGDAEQEEIEKAYLYFKISAKLDFPLAYKSIGLMNLFGYVSELNMDDALGALEKAGRLGDERSYLLLAEFYEKGIVFYEDMKLDRDTEMAKKYRNLAISSKRGQSDVPPIKRTH